MRSVLLSGLRRALPVLAVLLLSACANNRPAYDYSAFREARPASVLILPPLNNSPDIKATYSMLAHATLPLAEAGYYVFPVSLVDETFRHNGLTSPNDIHDVAPAKLREIFGADAVLYITVKQYGTSYAIIASETRVTADARLVDLRSGKQLWNGSATASSAEGDSNSGGLVGMLIKAAVRQIVETISEQGHVIAGVTATRLLSPSAPDGILYGPRSPLYQKDAQASR